jgi:type II secretory ATPase GspE/PulE/Tfp pilus assembly ATPase PilB-like protein
MAQHGTRALVLHEAGKESDRSIIALCAAMIEDAIARNASDIHLSPTATHLLIRLRRDGLLERPYTLPLDCHAELTARFKILSGLRTDDHQTPQDGRFTFLSRGTNEIELRVSVVPTRFGENIVIRILATGGHADSLSALGLSAPNEALFSEALSQTHGLILVTGPTGSGKSTTLYAALQEVAGQPRSVVTIEDPVEYALTGVTQVQVNTQAGITFAQGLRALMRQDPDVIMIGEIRDAETAMLAAQASLTGHLVLATLHTTNCEAVVPRLLSLGVDPTLVSDTIRLVTIQRLVRRFCSECNGGLSDPHCRLCSGSGYAGRIGIFELHAYEHGHAYSSATLMQDGLERVRSGLTSQEEVERVCHS